MALAAPGDNIYSTAPLNGYAYESGTSAASAHVAGVAALLIHNGVLDVRKTLTSTADDLGPEGFDPLYGYGLVDAAEAGTPQAPVNRPADISITAPMNGSVFASGVSITFTGSATDPEDGDLTAALTWTSGIEGQIGTGGNFAKTLSAGSHIITASVTDAGHLEASRSLGIVVDSAPPQPTTVSVASIDYATNGGKDGRRHLLARVSLRDNLGNAVAKASVSVQVHRGELAYLARTGVAGPDGIAEFKMTNAPAGYYTTIVTNVTARGLIWDSSATPLDPGFLKP